MTRREPPTVTPFIDYSPMQRPMLRYPLSTRDGSPGDLADLWNYLWMAGFDACAHWDYDSDPPYIVSLTWNVGGVEQHLSIADYLEQIDVHGRIVR